MEDIYKERIKEIPGEREIEIDRSCLSSKRANERFVSDPYFKSS
jgi:hypothetical protein